MKSIFYVTILSEKPKKFKKSRKLGAVMSKYALFMSKILTTSEINRVSAVVQSLRSEGRENEAVAMILRQTKSERHRFQVKTIESKIS